MNDWKSPEHVIMEQHEKIQRLRAEVEKLHAEAGLILYEYRAPDGSFDVDGCFPSDDALVLLQACDQLINALGTDDD